MERSPPPVPRSEGAALHRRSWGRDPVGSVAPQQLAFLPPPPRPRQSSAARRCGRCSNSRWTLSTRCGRWVGGGRPAAGVGGLDRPRRVGCRPSRLGGLHQGRFANKLAETRARTPRPSSESSLPSCRPPRRRPRRGPTPPTCRVPPLALPAHRREQEGDDAGASLEALVARAAPVGEKDAASAPAPRRPPCRTIRRRCRCPQSGGRARSAARRAGGGARRPTAAAAGARRRRRRGRRPCGRRRWRGGGRRSAVRGQERGRWGVRRGVERARRGSGRGAGTAARHLVVVGGARSATWLASPARTSTASAAARARGRARARRRARCAARQLRVDQLDVVGGTAPSLIGGTEQRRGDARVVRDEARGRRARAEARRAVGVGGAAGGGAVHVGGSCQSRAVAAASVSRLLLPAHPRRVHHKRRDARDLPQLEHRMGERVRELRGGEDAGDDGAVAQRRAACPSRPSLVELPLPPPRRRAAGAVLPPVVDRPLVDAPQVALHRQTPSPLHRPHAPARLTPASAPAGRTSPQCSSTASSGQSPRRRGRPTAWWRRSTPARAPWRRRLPPPPTPSAAGRRPSVPNWASVETASRGEGAPRARGSTGAGRARRRRSRRAGRAPVCSSGSTWNQRPPCGCRFTSAELTVYTPTPWARSDPRSADRAWRVRVHHADEEAADADLLQVVHPVQREVLLPPLPKVTTTVLSMACARTSAATEHSPSAPHRRADMLVVLLMTTRAAERRRRRRRRRAERRWRPRRRRDAGPAERRRRRRRRAVLDERRRRRGRLDERPHVRPPGCSTRIATALAPTTTPRSRQSANVVMPAKTLLQSNQELSWRMPERSRTASRGVRLM